MANKEQGKVELKAGDETFILRFGWNEIAEVETVLGLSSFFEDMVPKLGNPRSISGSEWRALLWAAMGGSASGKDLLEVGALMNRVGIEDLMAKILKAMELAFPGDEVVKENPPGASASAGMTQ